MSPTVVGGLVMIGSCAGSLYALDRSNGSPAWLYDTSADGSPAQFHGEPLLIGDRFIIPTDSEPEGHLYALDSSSGDVQWKLAFADGVATTPLLIDDRVVFVSAHGDVVSVDAKTGKRVWKTTPAGALKPMPFIPSPAHAANRVFVADNVGNVFAFDAISGKTLWQNALTARPNTALAIAGSSIVVGTADDFLNWISTDTGKTTKRIKVAEGHPYGTPIVSAPFLFVLAGGAKGTLLALDQETGERRWSRETPKEWTTYRPLVTGSSILAGSTEKDLCAFERTTGAVQWCRSVAQVPRGLGMSSDGVLYVGSLSGLVQAFRLRP